MSDLPSLCKIQLSAENIILDLSLEISLGAPCPH